jgi:hypothetical protein
MLVYLPATGPRYEAKLVRRHKPFTSSLAQEAIQDLTSNAFDTFYQGNYDALNKKYELVAQLANAYALSNDNNRIVSEALGFNLYLKGRTIANGELPSRVIGKVYPIFQRLLRMSRHSHSRLLYGYAHVLLRAAYYNAGGYSEAIWKHRFYKTSIRLAKKAIDNLPEDNHESIFALRSMAASASYIHDHEVLSYALKRAKRIIPRQPRGNYINTLHLSITLSKSMAAANMSDPFSIREFAASYFDKSLVDTGVYEISGIKEEVDTLLLLRTGEVGYIRSRLKVGLGLASMYKFPRQKKYFSKLLNTL